MQATAAKTANFVSHRAVLRIAVPTTLAYLTTPLLGLVDTAVIGQLGSAALIGGIAIGGVVFDLVFTSFNFLRSGTTGLTAQAMGAEDRTEMSAVLYRALLIATIAGLLVILLQWPTIAIGLYFLGGTEPVQEATREYFFIRIYSAPFLLANYVILGWLLGMGRAILGFLVQTFLNGLNILLSIWFVLGLDLGIPGVALATLISEIVTFALGFAIAVKILTGYASPTLRQILNKARFVRLFALNRDIMIRTFSLLFAFAFFTSRSSVQGDVVLAANSILMKFFLFASFFLDGFAVAAEQFAGRAVGAVNRDAFKRAVNLTLFWGFILALIASVALFLFGESAVAVITPNQEVREVAATYLVWTALTPIFGVLAFQMDGVYIGATWSQDMRNMMLVSLVLYLTSYVLLQPVLGNHGLWLALEFFLLIRGITLLSLLPKKIRQTMP